MKRAIVIEIECDGDTYSLQDIEKEMGRAIEERFNFEGSSPDDNIDVLHLEAADGTLKEKFGVGL